MVKTKWVYPLILLVLIGFVCLKSYTPGTFLSGWDTLHPEFDFGLNFKRLIFGVWRQEQGLGAVAGHSHMADLPRVFVLWIFHFFFPLNALRYLYIFLCLLLGPLGIYSLINHLFCQSQYRYPVAFLASLFYLVAPGAVQQFYVPFEMFPTQYAFLPWIILWTTKFLEKPTRKNLLFFSLATLFATPQAYAAHLWYPFFLSFLAFLLLTWCLNKTKIRLRTITTLILFTITINSFWLFPNLYYIFTSSGAPRINKNNRLHSQEFLLRNREIGTLKDVALNRGFYFNWEIFDFGRWRTEKLMPQWDNHFSNADILIIGYSLFFFAFLGFIISFKDKNKKIIPLAVFFILPFIFLANKTFPFNYFFDFLLTISFLKEVLRFVYTKFAILFHFGMTIFLAYFFQLSFRRLKDHLTTTKITLLVLILLIYGYPLFQGQLISEKVRIKIPQYYFQFWQFMKNQPEGKVLALPLHQPAGWQYYNWGYQGSGFIWFGLKQPIFDRDFDRWETKNEESFREFFYALYSNNPLRFAKTMKKYKVSYLVWDQAITFPITKNIDQVTFKTEISHLLSWLQKRNIVEKIGSFGTIQVFKIRQEKEVSIKEIKTISSLVSPHYLWHYTDAAYQSLGDYITSNNSTRGKYYPFRQILNKNNKLDLKKIKIFPVNRTWRIELSVPNIPSRPIIPQSNQIEKPLTEKFAVNKDRISLMIDSFWQFDAQEIWRRNKNSPGISFVNNRVKYSSVNSTRGTNLALDTLPHSVGYIIGIKSRNISGLPLRICFKNLYTGLCALLEEQLSNHKKIAWDFFLVPPTDELFGYHLLLNNISYGGVKSENEVEKIVVLPVPYHFLDQLYFELGNSFQQNKKYLAFYQSFNPHWLAFYLDGWRLRRLKNHLLINNWANGWEIDFQSKIQKPKTKMIDQNEKSTNSKAPITNHQSPITIYIFFWPQVLEFVGFGLLLETIVLTASSADRTKKE